MSKSNLTPLETLREPDFTKAPPQRYGQFLFKCTCKVLNHRHILQKQIAFDSHRALQLAGEYLSLVTLPSQPLIKLAARLIQEQFVLAIGLLPVVM